MEDGLERQCELILVGATLGVTAAVFITCGYLLAGWAVLIAAGVALAPDANLRWPRRFR